MSLEHTSEDSLARKLIGISQYVLIAAFGLLPIYFIPSLNAPFIYSKVLIVIVAVLLSLVLYSFYLLRAGTLRIGLPYSIIALWLIVLASVLSAIFSGDFRDAFIGNSFEVHTTLFVGLLALSATAWMLIGQSKAMVMRLYLLLAVSALVLSAFHIARLFFGTSFLGLGIFGGSPVLSPIGTWNNLAIFFGLTVILALVALEQLPLTNWGRAFFVVVVVSALIMLGVINFFAVWIVLGLVSLVVLIYALTRGRFQQTKGEVALKQKTSVLSIGISFVTLIVSIIFVIGGSVVGEIISDRTDISYIEVRPSLQATSDVVRDVYQEQAIFGVGPNKFIDAWRLHREPEINSTIFWNTDFQSGIGYIPTFFVTTGLVGGLLWVVFVGLFAYSGIRFLLRSPNTDRMWYFIGLTALVAGLYLWGMSFIYVPGPVLLLLAAMCTGLLYTAGHALMPDRVKQYSLIGNQRSSFIVIAASIIFIVISVGGVYSIGQHYAAAYFFTRSLNDAQNGADIQLVEELTARAFSLSADDQYARRVAEYEQARLASVLATDGGTTELQNLFQDTFTNGVNAGRAAIEQDPEDPNNWGVLGRLYATVVPLNIEGAYEQAQAALEKARELDPQNPSRLLALAQLEFLRQNYEGARVLAQDAITLKSNYSEAIYFVAQIDIATGNVEGAISASRSTTLLEPENPVRHFQLGVLELSDDNAEAAAASLERAVALNNSYSNARYFLAFAYDRLGRSDEAKEQLEEVLALNPGSAQVLGLIERIERGEGIVSVNEPVPETQEVSAENITETPLDENSEVPPTTEPVTSGEAPDSPLLTPANTNTENSNDGGGVEEESEDNQEEAENIEGEE